MGKLLINVILDRSGSMGGLVNEVIRHFNRYIEETGANVEGDVRVSLVQFDDQYEEVYLNKRIDSVPILTKDTYFARGSTALLDAVGRTIKAVDQIVDKNDRIIFVINTDGYENASREFNRAQIKEMIEERQTNHDYQFVFVGAGIDAFAEGASIGLRYHNITRTSSTPIGIGYGYETLALATNSYASGITSTLDMNQSSTDLGSEDEWAAKIGDKINKKVQGATISAK